MHSNTPISIIWQKNKTQNKQVTSQSPNTVSSFWQCFSSCTNQILLFYSKTNLLVSERATKYRNYKMLQAKNWLNIHNFAHGVNYIKMKLESYLRSFFSSFIEKLLVFNAFFFSCQFYNYQTILIVRNDAYKKELLVFVQNKQIL